MKKYFSKEVKIAISVIVSAVILYFGIEFLKGYQPDASIQLLLYPI